MLWMHYRKRHRPWRKTSVCRSQVRPIWSKEIWIWDKNLSHVLSSSGGLLMNSCDYDLVNVPFCIVAVVCKYNQKVIFQILKIYWIRRSEIEFSSSFFLLKFLRNPHIKPAFTSFFICRVFLLSVLFGDFFNLLYFGNITRISKPFFVFSYHIPLQPFYAPVLTINTGFKRKTFFCFFT